MRRTILGEVGINATQPTRLAFVEKILTIHVFI